MQAVVLDSLSDADDLASTFAKVDFFQCIIYNCLIIFSFACIMIDKYHFVLCDCCYTMKFTQRCGCVKEGKKRIVNKLNYYKFSFFAN